MDRLFEFIGAEFEALKRKVAHVEDRDIFQVPRLGGEHGTATGEDRVPILARLQPQTDVKPVALEVTLEPSEVFSVAEVAISGDDTYEERTELPGLPVRFELLPRAYTLRVTALGYKPRRKSWAFELYEEQPPPRILNLEPLPPETDEPLPPSLSYGVRGLEAISSARLIVASSDELAPLEVDDCSGKPVAGGTALPRSRASGSGSNIATWPRDSIGRGSGRPRANPSKRWSTSPRVRQRR